MLPPAAKLDKMLLKSARNGTVILIFIGSIYSDRFTDTIFGLLATRMNKTSNLMSIKLRKF